MLGSLPPIRSVCQGKGQDTLKNYSVNCPSPNCPTQSLQTHNRSGRVITEYPPAPFEYGVGWEVVFARMSQMPEEREMPLTDSEAELIECRAILAELWDTCAVRGESPSSQLLVAVAHQMYPEWLTATEEQR